MKTVEKTYHYGNGTDKTMTRIYADEGKAVTQDGETLWKSIDVESTDGWYEVDDPTEEEATDEEIIEALEGII